MKTYKFGKPDSLGGLADDYKIKKLADLIQSILIAKDDGEIGDIVEYNKEFLQEAVGVLRDSTI